LFHFITDFTQNMKIPRKMLWLAIRKIETPQETLEVIQIIYAKNETHLKTGKVYQWALEHWKD